MRIRRYCRVPPQGKSQQFHATLLAPLGVPDCTALGRENDSPTTRRRGVAALSVTSLPLRVNVFSSTADWRENGAHVLPRQARTTVPGELSSGPASACGPQCGHDYSLASGDVAGGFSPGDGVSTRG